MTTESTVSNQKSTDNSEREAGSRALPCSSIVWTRASDVPLCGHKTTPIAGGTLHERWELEVEWGQTMIFAVRLRGNKWDYHLGSIDGEGTIVDMYGDDVGWSAEDVELYAIIGEPYAPLSQTNDQGSAACGRTTKYY